MAELLGKDYLGGGRVRGWYREDDQIVVTTRTDAQPIVDKARRLYNDAPDRFGDGMHLVAEYPADVLEATAQMHGVPWREFMDMRSDRACRAWELLVNERDLRAFRTRPGYVKVKQK